MADRNNIPKNNTPLAGKEQNGNKMATITKKDGSKVITRKNGKIKTNIPAINKNTPKTGRVTKTVKIENKSTTKQSVSKNEDKYMDILIHLGNEKDFREFANKRLSKSYAFSEAGLSDQDFTLEELKAISVDGRTMMFRHGVSERNLSDTYDFINLMANSLLRKTFADASPKRGTTTTLRSDLSWTKEFNAAYVSDPEDDRYEGNHSILLPERDELVEALENNKKVILKNMAHTFSFDRRTTPGEFSGDLIISIDENKDLKIDYSQFECNCGAYTSNGSCVHSNSIYIALRQRLIDIDYTNHWERCGG